MGVAIIVKSIFTFGPCIDLQRSTWISIVHIENLAFIALWITNFSYIFILTAIKTHGHTLVYALLHQPK